MERIEEAMEEGKEMTAEEINFYLYTECQPLLNLAFVYLCYAGTGGLLDVVEIKLPTNEIQVKNRLCPEDDWRDIR